MYNCFSAEIHFERLVGTLPLDSEVLESYVLAKFKDQKPTEDEPRETKEVIGEDLDLTEEKEQSVSGFKRTEKGIYVGTYQAKAMLAQAASLLEITTSKRGSKQTLREGMIVLGKDKDDSYTGGRMFCLPYKTEADGISSRTGNVSSPSGSRSIVSLSEYVEDVTIKFELRILQNRMTVATGGKKLTTDDVKRCLAHSRTLGLGGERKYGSGEFSVVKFEELDTLSEADVIDF